jgi:hypothetical protein
MSTLTQITTAAMEYRDAMRDAAAVPFSLNTMIADAVELPALTPDVIAGGMILDHGLTRALSICLNTQLGGNVTEEQRQVALLVMMAAE